MVFGIKLDFQSYFNNATEFALKFRLVFASVFAIFISVQLYSSVNSILFPDIDFKASTVVNTSQQYVALNSDPFSSAKASAINQSIANSSESNKKGPETDLNIKLYGIVKSKEENVAIIGLPNEKQRSYKIGDKISGNLVVESIDDTFVNLRRNGKLESLSFAEVIKNKGFKQSIDPTKVASKDWLENLEMTIELGMSERFYKAKSRYKSPFISDLMIRIVHHCKSANLVDLKTGSKVPSRLII